MQNFNNADDLILSHFAYQEQRENELDMDEMVEIGQLVGTRDTSAKVSAPAPSRVITTLRKINNPSIQQDLEQQGSDPEYTIEERIVGTPVPM